MRKALIAGGILIGILAVSYLAFVNHVDPTKEVGLARNIATGETWVQDRGGYHLTAPWVLVSKVDTRPVRVCITSSAHAAVNCRLVQFDASHFEEFVRVEGFYYYWWSNRISFNMGYDDEYRGMRDLMRGYAFSAEKYPFIVVLNEYEGS